MLSAATLELTSGSEMQPADKVAGGVGVAVVMCCLFDSFQGKHTSARKRNLQMYMPK